MRAQIRASPSVSPIDILQKIVKTIAVLVRYFQHEKSINNIVAPGITAALKIILLNCGKRTNFWHLVLLGEKSCLRSRHLVLWSLETLTGQQRFYGSGLVT